MKSSVSILVVSLALGSFAFAAGQKKQKAPKMGMHVIKGGSKVKVLNLGPKHLHKK